MGRKLIETLQTFRVEGSIAGRTVGPVVTQYEVAPGPGVKVGRIAATRRRSGARDARPLAPIVGADSREGGRGHRSPTRCHAWCTCAS